jgi:hypothetical protein
VWHAQHDVSPLVLTFYVARTQACASDVPNAGA